MDVIEFIEIVEEDDDVIAAVLQNAAARGNDGSYVGGYGTVKNFL